MTRLSEIRARLDAARGLPVTIEFPPDSAPEVVAAMVYAVSDLYYLADRLETAEGLLRRLVVWDGGSTGDIWPFQIAQEAREMLA